MKAVQLLSFFFIIGLFFSCKTDSQKRQEKEQIIIDDLPGIWDVKEIKVKAIDDFYTKKAGVFRDTILTDFGTLRIDPFFLDTIGHKAETFAGSIVMNIDTLVLNAQINATICNSDCIISVVRGSTPDFDTQLGQFIKNLFILSHNYEVHFIEPNLVEFITPSNRAIETIILERQ